MSSVMGYGFQGKVTAAAENANVGVLTAIVTGMGSLNGSTTHQPTRSS